MTHVPDKIIAECPVENRKFGLDWGKEKYCFNFNFTCLLCKRCHTNSNEVKRFLPFIIMKEKYDEEKNGDFMEYMKLKIIEKKLEEFMFELHIDSM